MCEVYQVFILGIAYMLTECGLLPRVRKDTKHGNI